MALPDVSSLLWEERRLLDSLDAAAHRQRQADVARVRRAMSVVALLRAVEVEGVAAELGLRPGPTLGQLSAAAPLPWRDVLRDHHAALRLAAHLTAVPLQRSLHEFLA